MSEISSLAENFLQPAAWALVHFLWQGALVTAAVAAALALFRRSSRLRYAVACGGLGLMALLPFATFATLDRVDRAAPTAAPEVAASAPLASPDVGAAPIEVAIGMPAIEVVANRLEPFLPYLLAAWLVGVALLSLVHLHGWRRVRQLRSDTRPVDERWQAAFERLAARMGVARTVHILQTARLEVPAVVGWLRPAVLVPVSTFTGLSPQQLEAVLAHELAHVRRYDDLVNLLQVAVETLLFYHPGVWWVSRRVRRERENCCDDLAVRYTAGPVAYARALADLHDRTRLLHSPDVVERMLDRAQELDDGGHQNDEPEEAKASDVGRLDEAEDLVDRLAHLSPTTHGDFGRVARPRPWPGRMSRRGRG